MMTRNAWPALALSVILLAGWGNSASANLIQNGSFEDPVVVPDAQPFLNNNPLNDPYGGRPVVSLPGWSSATSDNSLGFTQNFVYNSTFDIVSQGNQAVLLNGDGIAETIIAQTFATVIGQQYVVSFDLALQFTTAQAPPVPVSVLASGNLGQSFDAVQGPTFVTHQYSFTATSISTVLAFTSQGGFVGASDASPLLDNVIVDAGRLTVPEPGTVALLGIGAFGLVLRRRRKAA